MDSHVRVVDTQFDSAHNPEISHIPLVDAERLHVNNNGYNIGEYRFVPRNKRAKCLHTSKKVCARV